jgi:hypothetical protein
VKPRLKLLHVWNEDFPNDIKRREHTSGATQVIKTIRHVLGKPYLPNEWVGFIAKKVDVARLNSVVRHFD